jgi:hypothetical protein
MKNKIIKGTVCGLLCAGFILSLLVISDDEEHGRWKNQRLAVVQKINKWRGNE